ncbi:MAG: AI-2E family transporter [Alphaproteobacteria bacterium]
MTTAQRAMAWTAGLLVFIALIFLLRDILLPFVVGMAIAYILDPVCDRLEARGFSRMLATTLVTALFFVIMLLIILLLTPLITAQIIEFVEKVPGYVATLRDKAGQLTGFVESRMSEEDIGKLQEMLGSATDPMLKYMAGFARGIVSGIGMFLTLLSLVVITPVVTFYLLRDWDVMIARVDSWLPREKAEIIREQVRLIDDTLAGFARGQALVCLLLGIFYAVGLTVVGLDFGIVVGFTTGLISFVPYFGMLFGFVVGMGIAIAQFGEVVPVLLVAAVFVVGQVLEGNFVTPKLVGDRVGLHAVWIIFALMAGGVLFGFLGVLIAVPVMVVIGVLTRFLLGQYLDSPLYDSEGKPREEEEGGT